MRNVGLILALGLVSMGASRCERDGDGEGGGQQGGGSEPGGAACGPTTCAEGQVCCNESCGICTEPGGFCTEQFCGDPDDPTPGDPGGGSGGGGEPGGGAACGPATCAEGQVCCNESCGICTDPGDGCTKQFCGDPGPIEPVRCGGITGEPCPGAGMCVDDPSDDCDPAAGGADCGGVCDCSGVLALCIEGTVWNDDPRVCGCEPKGDPGGGVACGPTTCAEGEVCCNESCGICTEPGGFCTEQFCGDPGEPKPGDPCDLACDPGQRCEYVEVTCIRAPCPPVAECVPAGPACGGFAGFTCPGEGECIDDPSDDCDPASGGADCGGLCACTVGPLIDCAPDKVFDDSPEVCACVDAAGGGGGEMCGNAECPAGQVCCNASCGICTPPDGACIQIACL